MEPVREREIWDMVISWASDKATCVSIVEQYRLQHRLRLRRLQTEDDGESACDPRRPRQPLRPIPGESSRL